MSDYVSSTFSTTKGSIRISGVSADGYIAGDIATTEGFRLQYQAFLIHGNNVEMLQIPGATSLAVSDINLSGVVVGNYAPLPGAPYQGFIFRDGYATPFSIAGAQSTIIAAVNSAGQFAGNFFDADPLRTSHGFIVTNGITATIDVPGGITGLNDDGAVVGFHKGPEFGTTGFLYEDGVLTTIAFPGAASTDVAGINARGDIYGSWSDGTGPGPRGFVLSNGEYTSIDVPGAKATLVEGVDASGRVYGYYLDGSGYHGFVRDDDGFASVYSAPFVTVNEVTHLSQVLGRSDTSAFISEKLDQIFRFYDTMTGNHFYTTSEHEKAQIEETLPTFQLEGVQWLTPAAGAPGTVDVYRFFDVRTQDHFFTSSEDERDILLRDASAEYVYEGVAFKAYTSASGFEHVTLDRFYNQLTGVHHFSANADETASILRGEQGTGWILEGAAFTVHGQPSDMLIL